jgi:hypothetical protein
MDNPTILSMELKVTREFFGYIYKRYEYASTEHLRRLWKEAAPWSTNDMAVSAPNLSLAALRDVAFRMPCHDHPNIS